MSVHGSGNAKLAGYFTIGGIIIVIAFLYEIEGWDFLTRNISFARETRKAFINEDGVPSDRSFKVASVTDSQTITVMIDDVEESIRLIGINTDECYTKQSKAYLTKIAHSEEVYLETDRLQGTRDTYGRILAYAYLQDGQMVNRKMLAGGFSYEYTYMNSYKYQKEFRNVQNIAKASERGQWSLNACNGKVLLQN